MYTFHNNSLQHVTLNTQWFHEMNPFYILIHVGISRYIQFTNNYQHHNSFQCINSMTGESISILSYYHHIGRMDGANVFISKLNCLVFPAANKCSISHGNELTHSILFYSE